MAGRFSAGGGGGGGGGDDTTEDTVDETDTSQLQSGTGTSGSETDAGSDTVEEDTSTDTSTDDGGDTTSGGTGFSPGGLSAGDAYDPGTDYDTSGGDGGGGGGGNINPDTDQIQQDVEQQQDTSGSSSTPTSGDSGPDTSGNINPDTDSIRDAAAAERQREQYYDDLGSDALGPTTTDPGQGRETTDPEAWNLERQIVANNPGLGASDVAIDEVNGNLVARYTHGAQQRQIREQAMNVEASLEEQVAGLLGTDVDLQPGEDFVIRQQNGRLVGELTDEFVQEQSQQRQPDVSTIDGGARGGGDVVNMAGVEEAGGRLGGQARQLEQQFINQTTGIEDPSHVTVELTSDGGLRATLTAEGRRELSQRERRRLDRLQLMDSPQPQNFEQQFEQSVEQETVSGRVPETTKVATSAGVVEVPVPVIGGQRVTFGGQARNVDVRRTADGTLTTTPGRERFGDWDIGIPEFVPGVGGQDVEEVTGAAGDYLVDQAESFGEGADLARPEPTIVERGDGTAYVQYAETPGVSEGEKTGIERFVENAPVGVAGIGDQVLNLPQEAGEFVAYGAGEVAAGRGEEFAGDVGGALGGSLIGAGRFAADNPYTFGGQVVGSAVATGGSIGAARAVGGARAGRAAAFAVQPGEELAISAARAGVPGATRVASTVGDLDRAQIEGRARAFADADRGQIEGRARAFADADRGQMQMPRGRQRGQNIRGTDPDRVSQEPPLSETAEVQGRGAGGEDPGPLLRFTEEQMDLQAANRVRTAQAPTTEGLSTVRQAQQVETGVVGGETQRLDVAQSSSFAEETAPVGDGALAPSVELDLGTEGAALMSDLQQEQSIPDIRQDIRGEVGSRQRDLLDTRTETRQETQSRQDLRTEQRAEARTETRQETRQEARQEARRETRQELRRETRQESRQEQRREVRLEIEPRIDTRWETDAAAPWDFNFDPPQFDQRQPSPPAERERDRVFGYLSETVFTGATLGGETPRNPSQETLAGIDAPTGEFPVAQMLDDGDGDDEWAGFGLSVGGGDSKETSSDDEWLDLGLGGESGDSADEDGGWLSL